MDLLIIFVLMIYRYIYLVSLILFLHILIFVNNPVFSITEKYNRGIIVDKILYDNKIVDFPTNSDSLNNYQFIDIDSVSYLYNKNFLNATFWVKSLDQLKSSNITGIIRYGILVNSDLNLKTGLEGTDYEYELIINISNNNKYITKELKEVSWKGDKKVILSDNKINWNDFFKGKNNYIDLNIDLRKILNSETYTILFYTIFQKLEKEDVNSLLIIDLTRRYIFLHQKLKFNIKSQLKLK